MDDKAAAVERVAEMVAADRLADASAHLERTYPFVPIEKTPRTYDKRQMIKVLVRDGFIDRYRGTRLVFPPALRLITLALPEQFPYHKNGKMTACHFAYWELFPSIDHVIPVARGGEDNESNWVCCSMLTNQIKANWTLDELGWKLQPPGDSGKWDGLLSWFVAQMTKESVRSRAPQYCLDWLPVSKEYARQEGF